MKPKFLILLVYASMALWLIGCKDRRAAAKRVKEALNPPKVVIGNWDAAAIKFEHGYGLMTIVTTRTNFHYRVWYSESAAISMTSAPTMESNSAHVVSLNIGGTQLSVGFGDASSTELQLEFGDYTTGLALIHAPGSELDVSKQSFTFARRINQFDLEKATGIR